MILCVAIFEDVKASDLALAMRSSDLNEGRWTDAVMCAWEDRWTLDEASKENLSVKTYRRMAATMAGSKAA